MQTNKILQGTKTKKHPLFEGVARFWHDRSPRAKEVIATGIGAAAIIGGGLSVGEAISPDEHLPPAMEQLVSASDRFIDQTARDLSDGSLQDGAGVSPEGVEVASHLDSEDNYTKVSVDQISNTVEIEVGTNHFGPDSTAVATYRIPPEHIDSFVQQIKGDGVDAEELRSHMDNGSVRRITSIRPVSGDLGDLVKRQTIDVMSVDGDEMLLKVVDDSVEVFHESEASAGKETKKVIDQFEEVTERVFEP